MSNQEILDSLRHEVASLKRDRRSMYECIAEGRKVMLELASAADGAALAGELMSDDLNQRVIAWVHRDPTLPPNG